MTRFNEISQIPSDYTGMARVDYSNYYKIISVVDGKIHNDFQSAILNFDWNHALWCEEWWQSGKRHRLDGAAIEWSNGKKEYWLYNKELSLESFIEEQALLRAIKLCSIFDLPLDYTGVAILNKEIRWYYKAQCHKLNGPAIIKSNGNTYWYAYGVLHREDGPAVEWSDGTKKWYKRGQLHRKIEDGPAEIYADGQVDFWVNGERIIL